jgi:ligand-binding sensor domain-containing protein
VSRDNPAAFVRETRVPFPVTSIAADGRGHLWIAGRLPGLTRYRLADGATTRYTTAEGLFDDEITRAVCDRAGNLWVSTLRGLFRVDRKDLDDFAEGRVRAIRSVAYGVADGMRTAEATAPEHQPSGLAASDGKLWFTTRQGVVVVDPNRLPANELAPPVHVEQVVADQEPVAGVTIARRSDSPPASISWSFTTPP